MRIRSVVEFPFQLLTALLAGGIVCPGVVGAAAKAPAVSAPAPAAPAAGGAGAVPPAAAPAPPASFDDLLKDALPAKDLSTLIEPLYARCDDSDDLRRRQCEGTRAYLLDYLHGHTFSAVSDVHPDTSPYDSAAKQVDMEVPGCLACTKLPRVAGELRYLVTHPPQRIVNGRAQVVPVASHEIELADRVHADRFVENVVPRLRTQHVIRIGAPFGDTPPSSGTGATVKGVLVTSLGHRVYDRCTGEVAAASPPSLSKVAVKPERSCPKSGTEQLSLAEQRHVDEIAALPEHLTPHQIDQVLAPVQAHVHECYVEFGEPSGTAKVQLTIGGEGKLTQIHMPAPFDKADIGLCLRAQLKSANFPKFRGEAMSIDYVYQVN
jgi:hypothetical protein